MEHGQEKEGRSLSSPPKGLGKGHSALQVSYVLVCAVINWEQGTEQDSLEAPAVNKNTAATQSKPSALLSPA